jgi:nucleoside-diphosphate-sugar epimerase
VREASALPGAQVTASHLKCPTRALSAHKTFPHQNRSFSQGKVNFYRKLARPNSTLNRILTRVSLDSKTNEIRRRRFVALSVLFVGGTGQISLTSVREAVAAGHQITVFNRGTSSLAGLPGGVTRIVGDIHDPGSYAKLSGSTFDVVCAFMVFRPEQISQDITTFSGRVGQYIFISSASVYQKPAKHYIITEKTPLENPYWEYSRQKIACELRLQDQSKLSYTIVRPSHTIRTRLPVQIGDPMTGVRRMLTGKSVLVTGDGTSPWTLTRANDFSVPFVRLFGNHRALGQDFHITSDRAFTWDQIHTAIGRAFGVETRNFHVPTDTLIRYNPEWTGPLVGDKKWTALFDNSKIKSVVSQFTCSEDLDEILAEPIAQAKLDLKMPHDDGSGQDEDTLMDRIIADQSALGSH